MKIVGSTASACPQEVLTVLVLQFDHAEAMFLCVTVSVKQALDPERSTVVLPRGHAASILYDKRHRQRIAHEPPDTENFSDLKRNILAADLGFRKHFIVLSVFLSFVAKAERKSRCG